MSCRYSPERPVSIWAVIAMCAWFENCLGGSRVVVLCPDDGALMLRCDGKAFAFGTVADSPMRAEVDAALEHAKQGAIMGPLASEVASLISQAISDQNGGDGMPKEVAEALEEAKGNAARKARN